MGDSIGFTNNPLGETKASSDVLEGAKFLNKFSDKSKILIKDIDELETINIKKAFKALQTQTFTGSELLTIEKSCEIHQMMFDDLWEWAGSFRKENLNIGDDFYQVSANLLSHLEDTKTWLTHDSYETIEVLSRFHHKLTKIHPFKNGNGRWARVYTILLAQLMEKNINFDGIHNKKSDYINALRDADNRNYKKLIEFFKPIVFDLKPEGRS